MSETINLATFKEVYLLIDENPDVDIRVLDKINSIKDIINNDTAVIFNEISREYFLPYSFA